MSNTLQSQDVVGISLPFPPFLRSKWHVTRTPSYIFFPPFNSTNFLVTSSETSILKPVSLFAVNKIHSIILWRTSYIHVKNIFNTPASHFLDFLNNDDLYLHSNSLIYFQGSCHHLEFLYHWINQYLFRSVRVALHLAGVVYFRIWRTVYINERQSRVD